MSVGEIAVPGICVCCSRWTWSSVFNACRMSTTIPIVCSTPSVIRIFMRPVTCACSASGHDLRSRMICFDRWHSNTQRGCRCRQLEVWPEADRFVALRVILVQTDLTTALSQARLVVVPTDNGARAFCCLTNSDKSTHQYRATPCLRESLWAHCWRSARMQQFSRMPRSLRKTLPAPRTTR
jgi:hypothetical protein